MKAAWLTIEEMVDALEGVHFLDDKSVMSIVRPEAEHLAKVIAEASKKKRTGWLKDMVEQRSRWTYSEWRGRDLLRSLSEEDFQEIEVAFANMTADD